MSDQDIQQFHTFMLKREMDQRAALFTKLVETFGSQVLNIVEETVIEQTKETLEKAELPKRDLDTVMEILWNQTGDKIEFTVESQTAEYLRLKVTRCLFADEMRKLNAADIGFAFYCSYDDGFCQGLNPAIKFSRTKTLMQGDDCCDHTYKLEES